MACPIKPTSTHFILAISICVLISVISGLAWHKARQQVRTVSDLNQMLVVQVAEIEHILALKQQTPDRIIRGSVTAADLSSGTVAVTGNLGIPLKTMATVRGTWRYSEGPTKERGPWFLVTNVNGKALNQLVEFHRGSVHVEYPSPNGESGASKKVPTPSDEDTWELRAYEIGAFHAPPVAYYEETGRGDKKLVQRAVWDRNFLTELHGIMPRPDPPAEKVE
jgi:hypothetical protein